MAPLRLSVIIPVFNGAGFLARCLEAVFQSDVLALECIVVDDGSTDESIETAEAMGAKVFSTGGRKGPAAARNLGVAHATGDIAVFVDSDVCLAPDALRRMRAWFESEPDLDAVIGSYDDSPEAPGVASQYKNLLHHYVHQHGKPAAATFWTGCGAIRRHVFEANGGLDETYTRPCTEDVEFGYRLREAGHRILLDRNIQAKHLKQFHLLKLLETDIFQRALPWTRLILRSKQLPNDLNVSVPQRVSAALTVAGAASVLISPFLPLLLFAALAAFATVTALNWDFYRFLAAKRGWLFTIAALPLHQAYYFYSPVCFGIGLLLHCTVWRFQPTIRHGQVFASVVTSDELPGAEPETVSSFSD